MSKKYKRVFNSLWRVTTMMLVLLAPLFAYTLAIQPKEVKAATNSTLNFQARLLNAAGGVVPDGQYNVEFKIYNAATSSGSSQGSCSGDVACVWTETRTTTNKVRVVNGYLTVNLGSVTAFGSTIQWDQELWLTMNIGGTGTVAWDGEMNPRLKLTAVPYAFRAGQLVSQNGSNTSVVSFTAPTANRTITIPDASGTICLQGASACGFLTGTASDYIQNQASVSQLANFRISGAGRADVALQSPQLDTPSAGILTLGTTNATSISLNQNTTLAASKNLTVTSGNTSLTGVAGGSSSALSVQTGAATNRGISVTAASAQTADLIYLQNSSSAMLVSVSSAGNMLFGGSADKSISIQQSASGNDGRALTIQAGSGNGTDRNGGILLLQGGNSTGAGTPGSVVVRPQTDATAAFQVQNSAATTTVLSADTVNGRVGIGTNAPTRQLDISVNNASTDALPLLVRQSGSGDSGLEVRTTTQSYYIGADTSDGSRFKISSSSAGGTSVLGNKPSSGGSVDSGDSDAINGSKFTASATGTISALNAFVASPLGGTSNRQAQMAIYADNAGTPANTPLGTTSTGTLVADTWNTFSLITPVNITNGQTYWIAYNTNGTAANQNNMRFNDTGVNGNGFFSNGFSMGSWNLASGTVNLSTYRFWVYAAVDVAAGSNNFANNLFQLSATGQATFKSNSESLAAFQVQDAAGAAVLNVDTVNSRVHIGPISGSTTGSVLVLGNKTSAGDPVGIAGGMYYNSSTGNFRCYQAGMWQNCLGGLIGSSITSTTRNTCTTNCASVGSMPNSWVPDYCQPGRTYQVYASGVYSSAAATTPTLGFSLYLGNNATTRASNTQLGTTGTTPNTGMGVTNMGWELDAYIVCNTTTTVIVHGSASIQTNTTGAVGISKINSVSTYTVSNTATQTLYLFPTWSASAAGNTVTCNQFIVQAM